MIESFIMIFVIRPPEQHKSESFFGLGRFSFKPIKRETLIPTMDSDEDNIFVRLQFINDLVLPVIDTGY